MFSLVPHSPLRRIRPKTGRPTMTKVPLRSNCDMFDALRPEEKNNLKPPRCFFDFGGTGGNPCFHQLGCRRPPSLRGARGRLPSSFVGSRAHNIRRWSSIRCGTPGASLRIGPGQEVLDIFPDRSREIYPVPSSRAAPPSWGPHERKRSHMNFPVSRGSWFGFVNAAYPIARSTH